MRNSYKPKFLFCLILGTLAPGLFSQSWTRVIDRFNTYWFEDSQGPSILQEYGDSRPRDLNTLDAEGRTFLGALAQKGQWSLMEQAVQMGANPNLKDSEGRLALHHLLLRWADQPQESRSHNLPIRPVHLTTADKQGVTPLLLWWEMVLDETYIDVEYISPMVISPVYLGALPALLDSFAGTFSDRAGGKISMTDYAIGILESPEITDSQVRHLEVYWKASARAKGKAPVTRQAPLWLKDFAATGNPQYLVKAWDEGTAPWTKDRVKHLADKCFPTMPDILSFRFADPAKPGIGFRLRRNLRLPPETIFWTGVQTEIKPPTSPLQTTESPEGWAWISRPESLFGYLRTSGGYLWFRDDRDQTDLKSDRFLSIQDSFLKGLLPAQDPQYPLNRWEYQGAQNRIQGDPYAESFSATSNFLSFPVYSAGSPVPRYVVYSPSQEPYTLEISGGNRLKETEGLKAIWSGPSGVGLIFRDGTTGIFNPRTLEPEPPRRWSENAYSAGAFPLDAGGTVSWARNGEVPEYRVSARAKTWEKAVIVGVWGASLEFRDREEFWFANPYGLFGPYDRPLEAVSRDAGVMMDGVAYVKAGKKGLWWKGQDFYPLDDLVLNPGQWGPKPGMLVKKQGRWLQPDDPQEKNWTDSQVAEGLPFFNLKAVLWEDSQGKRSILKECSQDSGRLNNSWYRNPQGQVIKIPGELIAGIRGIPVVNGQVFPAELAGLSQKSLWTGKTVAACTALEQGRWRVTLVLPGDSIESRIWPSGEVVEDGFYAGNILGEHRISDKWSLRAVRNPENPQEVAWDDGRGILYHKLFKHKTLEQWLIPEAGLRFDGVSGLKTIFPWVIRGTSEGLAVLTPDQVVILEADLKDWTEVSFAP